MTKKMDQSKCKCCGAKYDGSGTWTDGLYCGNCSMCEKEGEHQE